MAERRYSFKPTAAAAGLALVACFFLANASISERNKRLLAENDAQVVRAQTVLTALEEVLATVTEAEAKERGFLITGDESYLQHIAVGWDKRVERAPAHHNQRFIYGGPALASSLVPPYVYTRLFVRQSKTKSLSQNRQAGGTPAPQYRFCDRL